MSIGAKLRRMIFVRKVDVAKEPQARYLIEANKERNAYDGKVLDYPCTEVFAAHTNGTTHAYLPVQTVAVLDSVGVNPSSSAQEVAAGMMELVKAVAVLAHRSGMREVMFLSSDENTVNGAKQMGFVELDCKVLRLRLGE